MSVPPARRRGVGGVLVDVSPLRRHRGFRWLWTGQLIAATGSQLTVVAVSYQTYRITSSTAMVGLVSLGQLLAHPLLWPMCACTAESAALQGVDWAARRASLRGLVPPSDLAAALSLQSV